MVIQHRPTDTILSGVYLSNRSTFSIQLCHLCIKPPSTLTDWHRIRQVCVL